MLCNSADFILTLRYMDSAEIRKKFLEFFKERGHVVVPSSSLIPDDPSVLLTTAGMQQFKPYLTGKADPIKDFSSRNVFSVQKCFRTTDIDEIGDETHLTFFEMAGNFSFGGYFKERAISLSFEFLTSKKGLGLDPKRIYITAFEGDESAPRDDEAIGFWQQQFKKVGIDAKVGERIFLYGHEKNWWEAGLGPAGPDAEMFYDRGLPHDPKFGPTCHPNCDCGRFVEIGNDVFVQYDKRVDGTYKVLEQKAIDNGRGFERLVTILQGKNSVFETDLFEPIVSILGSMSDWSKRIIADHSRGIVFLIADGVVPNNKAQGYVLRRLMRRVLPHLLNYQLAEPTKEGGSPSKLISLEDVASIVIQQYSKIDAYNYLLAKKTEILRVIHEEGDRFHQVYAKGEKILDKLIVAAKQRGADKLSGHEIFDLVGTHGFSIEWIKDIAKMRMVNLDLVGFDEEFRKHQELSRAGVEKKFGGHGLVLDTGELKAGSEEEMKKVLRLHTATHLLQQALREVLGPEVHQMGSDIAPERTRFDFSFPRKMTPEEIKKVEEIVNQKIKEDLPVSFKEMPKAEAEKLGVLHFFREKYPENVKVYYVGRDLASAWSKEFCGGPHVARTGEIGYFKIVKEEAVGAGVRRVRGVVDR